MSNLIVILGPPASGKAAILIRSLRSDDTERVVAFYQDAHSEDETIAPISAKDWERFVRHPVNLGGLGFRVAEVDGRIVGLATSSIRIIKVTIRHFRILVRRCWRHQGIGSQLLRLLIELDPMETKVIFQSLCPTEWTQGRHFLEQREFKEIEKELRMRCDISKLVPPMPFPEISIERSSQPSVFGTEVADLHNAAYAQDVSFVPYTGNAMSALLSDGVELWLLRKRKRIIGYCHVEPGATTTWLDSLVIAPELQNHGLGAWFCAEVVSRILSTPGHAIQLQVSDQNRAAIKVYEKLGFYTTSVSHRLRAPRSDVDAACLRRLASGARQRQ